GNLYSNDACTSGITSTAIATGGSSATVYYKNTAAGAYTLTATTTGLTNGTKAITVIPTAPTQITASDATSTVGACTGVTVTFKDQYGNAAELQAITGVTLTAGASVTKYGSSAACAASTSSMTVNNGTSTATFYVIDTIKEQVSVTLAGASLTLGTASVSFAGAGPSSVSIAGAGSVAVSECAAFTADLKDQFGNVATNASGTTVTLAASGGTLYSNSGCTTSTSTVSEPPSTVSAAFYYKNATAQTVTLTATRNALTTGTKGVTVSVGAPASMTLTGGSPSVFAGYCSDRAYTLSLVDAYGNQGAAVQSTLNVTLSGLSGAEAYSSSDCITGLTSVLAMTSGQTAAVFYMSGTVKENVSVSLTDGVGGIVDTSLSLSVSVKPFVMATGSGTCAVFDNGAVKCWGLRAYEILQTGAAAWGDEPSELGDATTFKTLASTKTPMRGSESWIDASPQRAVKCAILSDHSFKCWGWGTYGSLGNESTTALGNAGDNIPYVNLGTGRTVYRTAGSYSGHCVILDTRQVKCWGANTTSSSVYLTKNGYEELLARG
ncbi:MAG: hypothetical protein AAB425_15125, partial [Bdellovibrionota bacterium]